MPATDHVSGLKKPDYLKKIAYNIFELGHGYRTCAMVLDLSVYTVREWYAQYKLGYYESELTSSKPKQKAYSLEFRQKVIKDYLDTKPSITELAKRYEVSKRTVRRWIQEYQDNNPLTDCEESAG